MDMERIKEIADQYGMSKEVALSLAEEFGLPEFEMMLEDFYGFNYPIEEAEEALYA